jgi:hypothetical protein
LSLDILSSEHFSCDTTYMTGNIYHPQLHPDPPFSLSFNTNNTFRNHRDHTRYVSGTATQPPSALGLYGTTSSSPPLEKCLRTWLSLSYTLTQSKPIHPYIKLSFFFLLWLVICTFPHMGIVWELGQGHGYWWSVASNTESELPS